MKTLIATLCIALAVAGCSSAPVIKTEIVKVNVPVPFVPPPPAVPSIKYKVDTLVPADKTTPGKVGQAYVYDMTFLRSRIEIDDLIFQQYKSGSVDFTAIDKKIQELFSNVGPTVDPK